MCGVWRGVPAVVIITTITTGAVIVLNHPERTAPATFLRITLAFLGHSMLDYVKSTQWRGSTS
jgi:hypothetical protein